MKMLFLFSCAVALKKGPDVVLFYFLPRPFGFTQESEARVYTRIHSEALYTYLLPQGLPPIVRDQFFHNGLE